ncbi:hypothetical protein P879_02878 [Paragonimus westermani]|uniref:Uncharacterized protein n=1 Tax=Paragonimus westermani TaxID=34504 RepID=A0A8T0DWQ3_9TREM|nr:hypothetical protein P879_02878 [Paragonimus westermani]
MVGAEQPGIVSSLVYEHISGVPPGLINRKALRYERILPILLKWYEDSVELAPFVLPSFLTMVHVSEKGDFDVYLREHLVSMLSKKKTLQVRKLSSLTDDVITIVHCETVQNAISILPAHLHEDQLRRQILPQLQDMFNRKTSSTKVILKKAN